MSDDSIFEDFVVEEENCDKLLIGGTISEESSYSNHASSPTNFENSSEKSIQSRSSDLCDNGNSIDHLALNREDCESDVSANSTEPQQFFNDTLEEVEMLLKYGLDYDERIKKKRW